MIRDVKKIRISRYPQIKPATGRNWILKMDIRSIFYTRMLTGRGRVS